MGSYCSFTAIRTISIDFQPYPSIFSHLARGNSLVLLPYAGIWVGNGLRRRVLHSTPFFAERNCFGRADVSLQDFFHQAKGVVIFSGGIGNDAVAGNEQFEIPHVSVVGGEEDANVAGNAGEDEFFCAEMRKEEIEPGGIKSGMLGFEHEIILLGGAYSADERLGGAARLQAVIHLSLKVGAPAAEVVVDVDDWRAGGVRFSLERQKFFAHGQRRVQERPASGKVEVVDDIDEQEGPRGFVRGVPVKVRMLSAHIRG